MLHSVYGFAEGHAYRHFISTIFAWISRDHPFIQVQHGGLFHSFVSKSVAAHGMDEILCFIAKKSVKEAGCT